MGLFASMESTVTENAPDASVNPGKVHADLMGSVSSFRFRPERLDAQVLRDTVACTFEIDGQRAGPFAVVDVSSTGIGVIATATDLPPGSVLKDMRVDYRGRSVWQGEATCVYAVDHPNPRVGLRLTSSVFDVAKLQVSGSDVENTLASELAQYERVSTLLPAEWIAGVAMLRKLLDSAKYVFDRAEQDMRKQSSQDTNVRVMNVEATIDLVHKTWGPLFYQHLVKLHQLSTGFSPEKVELGRAYATSQLLDALMPCPMHSRAYSKPRGYAGDYRLMTMYFKDVHEGPTLYSRFLHYTAKHYGLGHTVVARVQFLRELLGETAKRVKEPRIVSLACGPGLEIRHWLADAKRDQKVKFILVDQDDEALSYLHSTLNQDLLNKYNSQLPVDLHTLHFSVKQVLKPRDEAEQRLVREELQDADLIYTAGLFDYLPQNVAQMLTQRLYSLLRPGGRLLIGNLRETPDTSWMMEYVLSWHLVYRNDADMLDMAKNLKGTKSINVRNDKTGSCMFLDVEKA